MSHFQLLSKANPKIIKGEKKGYMTYILHLAPADLCGIGNTCAGATAGCKASCLNTAGRGGLFKPGETTNVIQKARIRRTIWFFTDRDGFMLALASDITKAIKQATKRGFIPVFRLNGTSDLPFEKYSIGEFANIFEMFSDVQFYDYTKIYGRKVSHIDNYYLTFSRAESNDKWVEKAYNDGMNIAVVFDKLPETFMGRPVFNGDESDLRFLDPDNHIIGLKAKGKAKRDTSGFVVKMA